MKRKNYYRSGRIAEGKVAKRLKELGFRNIRLSKGSRGPAGPLITFKDVPTTKI